MKTSELIERLKELDPSGKLQVVYHDTSENEFHAISPGISTEAFTSPYGGIFHDSELHPSRRVKGCRKIKVISL